MLVPKHLTTVQKYPGLIVGHKKHLTTGWMIPWTNCRSQETLDYWADDTLD